MTFSLKEFCEHQRLSDTDKQIAKNNISNALKHINPKMRFNENTKLISFLGNSNVVIKINNDYYRIYYRKIDSNVINRNIKTFNVLSKGGYGILPPLELQATDKYIYAKIKYIGYFQGATIIELKNLLKKTLKLAKHGLIFTDIHPFNLKTLNNKLIIIDYDLNEEVEIKDMIRDAMKEFKIKSTSTSIEIMKVVRSYVDKNIGGLNCFYLICLIAKCKNFTNALDFMRIFLSDALFEMKNNLPDGVFNKARFEHLMDVNSYEL